MKRYIIIRNDSEVIFEGEVEFLEIEMYEHSTELEFKRNNIDYKLEIPRGYVLVIK